MHRSANGMGRDYPMAASVRSPQKEMIGMRASASRIGYVWLIATEVFEGLFYLLAKTRTSRGKPIKLERATV